MREKPAEPGLCVAGACGQRIGCVGGKNLIWILAVVRQQSRLGGDGSRVRSPKGRGDWGAFGLRGEIPDALLPVERACVDARPGLTAAEAASHEARFRDP